MDKIFVMLVVLIFINGCSSQKNLNITTNKKNSNYFIKKKEYIDNQYMVLKDLTLFLNTNGIEAKIYNEDEIKVNLNGGTFLIEPIFNKSLSRLAVEKHYSINKKYYNSVELIVAILELNNRFNIGSFSSPDKKTIRIRGNVTLNNKVSFDEVFNYLNTFDAIVPLAYEEMESVKLLAK